MAVVIQEKTKLQLRNEKIRGRYAFLSNQKHLKNQRILEMLEAEFLPLEQQTIWLIISQTGYYKDK